MAKENVNDRTDELFAALEAEGWKPTRQASNITGSPYTYLEIRLDDADYVLVSDGAEDGEDGEIFVGHWADDNEEALHDVASVQTIPAMLAKVVEFLT